MNNQVTSEALKREFFNNDFFFKFFVSNHVNIYFIAKFFIYSRYFIRNDHEILITPFQYAFPRTFFKATYLLLNSYFEKYIKKSERFSYTKLKS